MIIILYKGKYLSKTRFSFQEYTLKRYEMIDSSALWWMDNVLFDTNISPLGRGDRAPKAALPKNRAIYIHSSSIMPAPADGKDKSLNAIQLSSPFPRNDKLFSIITADDEVRSRVKYEEHPLLEE